MVIEVDGPEGCFYFRLKRLCKGMFCVSACQASVAKKVVWRNMYNPIHWPSSGYNVRHCTILTLKSVKGKCLHFKWFITARISLWWYLCWILLCCIAIDGDPGKSPVVMVISVYFTGEEARSCRLSTTVTRCLRHSQVSTRCVYLSTRWVFATPLFFSVHLCSANICIPGQDQIIPASI